MTHENDPSDNVAVRIAFKERTHDTEAVVFAAASRYVHGYVAGADCASCYAQLIHDLADAIERHYQAIDDLMVATGEDLAAAAEDDD